MKLFSLLWRDSTKVKQIGCEKVKKLVRFTVPDLTFSDTAGHHLRSQSYGFDGREIDTDFTYDGFGRLINSYQPAYAGDAEVIANTKDYDELNRVRHVTSLDEGNLPLVTTTDYHGLSVVVTNPAGQQKTRHPRCARPIGAEHGRHRPNHAVRTRRLRQPGANHRPEIEPGQHRLCTTWAAARPA